MSPRQSGIETVRARMLTLLPKDGTPVLNRVMRVMLARSLGRDVDEEMFFKARDSLVDEALIGRLRGQGGQLFLAREEQPAIALPAPKQKDAWAETALMEPLERYLKGSFCKNLDLPKGSACLVQNTSVLGSLRGRWSRPDFILVSAMRFRLMPGAQVDLHSFELKTESGGSVLAIHEALAQTRFTHFGHFVWHLPEGSKSETMLDDIATHCEEHGIGLIRMRDPNAAEPCEILIDPRRKPTLASVVDGFLEISLMPDQKNKLTRALGATL